MYFFIFSIIICRITATIAKNRLRRRKAKRRNEIRLYCIVIFFFVFGLAVNCNLNRFTQMVSSAFKRFHNLLTNQTCRHNSTCVCVCAYEQRENKHPYSYCLCDERYILISHSQKTLTQVVDLQIGFYDLSSSSSSSWAINCRIKLKIAFL